VARSKRRGHRLHGLRTSQMLPRVTSSAAARLSCRSRSSGCRNRS
jgi:hypothetical protein